MHQWKDYEGNWWAKTGSAHGKCGEELEGEKRRDIVAQEVKMGSTNPKTLKEEMKGVTLKAGKLGEKNWLVELNSKRDKSMVMNNNTKVRNSSVYSMSR